MARTGLRMMPTFPSPSLKFRTAGFPQYGFKASLSGRACPPSSVVKPAPDIPTSADGLPRPFARFRPAPPAWHCVQSRAEPPRAAAQETHVSLPQGSLAPVRVLLSRPSSLLRPHPPVSPARSDFAAPPLIRCAFAVRERLGDPRDLPYFPRPAFSACRRPYAGGSAQPSRCAGRAIPGFLDLRASRHPQDPSLPAIPDGVILSTLHRSLSAAARAFARPSTLASEVPCHPRFSRRPSPGTVGSQARGANGKSPLVGTLTRPVHGKSVRLHRRPDKGPG